MSRPITLCTGQWADLPLETLAQKCQAWGFDGLELACWGDHFEVDKAMADPDYCAKKRQLWTNTGCRSFRSVTTSSARPCWTSSTSGTSLILPPYVWGDGDPAGVNARAAEEAEADGPGRPASWA